MNDTPLSMKTGQSPEANVYMSGHLDQGPINLHSRFLDVNELALVTFQFGSGEFELEMSLK